MKDVEKVLTLLKLYLERATVVQFTEEQQLDAYEIIEISKNKEWGKPYCNFVHAVGINIITSQANGGYLHPQAQLKAFELPNAEEIITELAKLTLLETNVLLKALKLSNATEIIQKQNEVAECIEAINLLKK